MTLAAILNAISLVGSNTPAFLALFEQIKDTFGEDDRATLEAAYAEAMAVAEEQHRRAQSL